MNNFNCCGRIVSMPRSRLIPIDDMMVSVCTFTVAMYDGITDDTKEYDDASIDYIECIAFSDVAKFICEHFFLGAKVLLSGKLKNYCFEDGNKTKHFTQVFLVNHTEYGDTLSAYKKFRGVDKAADASIEANIGNTLERFKEISKNGFLCIDEESYYRLALSSQIMYRL